MPTSPLDQAGPSGMSGNPADKAAAGNSPVDLQVPFLGGVAAATN